MSESDNRATSELSEILDIVKRRDRSNRSANLALFIVVVIAGATAMTAAATFSTKVNRDHQRIELLTDANIKMLDYLASDHPTKDSIQLLEQIRDALEAKSDGIYSKPNQPGRR